MSFFSNLFGSQQRMGTAGAIPEPIVEASKTASPLHQYYPTEIEVLGYIANTMSVPMLLASFSGGCAAIFSITYLIVKRVRPSISNGELATILWFVLCGCIHTFFEGYFVFNFRNMGRMQDLFGQLWKEYSLSDSRYLTQNAFVLCMETITAVCWGPLSFAVAALIATDHHLRYPLQAVISLGQLYGDVLYYATSMFDESIYNLSYCRPEAYYFWGYFVFMNAFWIIIPIYLLHQSISKSGAALKALKQGNKAAMSNGSAKKVQ